MIFDRFLQIGTAIDCSENGVGDFGVVGDVIPLTTLLGGSDVRDLGSGTPVRIHFETTTAFTRSAGVGTWDMQVVLADNTALTSNVIPLVGTPQIGSSITGNLIPAVGFQFEVVIPKNISLGHAVYNRKYLGILGFNTVNIVAAGGNLVTTLAFTIRALLDVHDAGKVYPASTGFPAGN